MIPGGGWRHWRPDDRIARVSVNMPSPPARSLLSGLALALPLALAGPVAHAGSSHYTLDPGASRLTIHVGKAGLMGFVGHEHEVVAGTFHGAATFDPEKISQSTVDLTFDVGALQVEGKGEPSGDVPQVQAAMVGPACLDAHRFATVHFVSKTVKAAAGSGSGARDLTLVGDLTLHGVTRPLTLQVRVALKADTLEATGSTKLRQTDFGITPISKAGVVKVKDELTLDWRIRGTVK
jgi:polyisoprenoid-binding protein YceI